MASTRRSFWSGSSAARHAVEAANPGAAEVAVTAGCADDRWRAPGFSGARVATAPTRSESRYHIGWRDWERSVRTDQDDARRSACCSRPAFGIRRRARTFCRSFRAQPWFSS
jgi:hypothetical protein